MFNYIYKTVRILRCVFAPIIVSLLLVSCTNSANNLGDLAPIGQSGTNQSSSNQIASNTGLRPSLPIDEASDQRAVPTPNLPQGTDPALRKKIGQMLMLGFKGTSSSAAGPRRLAQQIARGEVGGVLFLGHNVRSASGVKSLTKLFGNTRYGIAPLISIDQEGGAVQRLKNSIGFRTVPSAQRLAQSASVSTAFAQYSRMAAGLRAWGFNTNFGPVVDLLKNPNNPIIAAKGRAYSHNAQTAIGYARSFVDAHRGQRIATSLKHFPGHGSSKTDSHLGFTDISSTWSQDELEPFRQLIGEGRADMVMVGHLYLKQFAPSAGKAIPASLSGQAITGLLRNQLGYQGVVITDDLKMGAIRQHFSQQETILRAVRAGVDILMLSNSARTDLELPSKVISMLEIEAQKDPQIRRNIEASYQRIMALKRKYL